MRLKGLLFFSILLICGASAIPGQTDAEDVPATPIYTEELQPLDSLEADTSEASETPTYPEKRVSTAMLLSTFIPGGGQFYTRHWIKGVLLAGGEITLGYFTVQEHIGMQEALRGDLSDSLVQREVDSLRNRRNVFAFFTGAVIAYAVADAYVDAHMFGFAEAQRLTIGPARERIGLTITYKF